jgi:biotin carboxyl carrier protein
MTFDIEVNGRGRLISIERASAGKYRVIVDGRAQVVDAIRVGSFGLSLLFDGADGSSRDIQVAPAGAPGEVLVSLDGRWVTAVVNGRRAGRASVEGSAHARGEQRVVAPMPGRVVRLLVAIGDEVAARQPIVVVEAMKMENELRTPKAGRVKEIAVAAGDSVEAGRMLVLVE